MDLMKLGQVLEERRKSIGIPKAEIARRINVSDGYVSLVERGSRRPSKGVLLRWTKALSWEDREDDPYTRQVLLLAGHIMPEVSEYPKRPPLPFGAAGALNFPQPRGLERERLLQEFGQFVDKADATTAARWKGTVEVTRAFLKEMTEIFDSTGVSAEDWNETVRLLTCYLEWLQFRMRGKT